LKTEFDRYAAEYDRLLEEALPASDSERYFAEYKVQLLKKRSQGRSISTVLDFGCGTGRSIPFLLRLFPQARVFGFDPSDECLHRARASFPGAHFESNIERFAAHSFDLVLAANVFHHVLPDQRSNALNSCKNLLADEGRLGLFEHNPVNPLTRLVFERCVFDRDAHMLPMREVKALARSAGLSVCFNAYTLFFPPALRALRSLEPMLSKVPLGAQYYVEMAK
jgi:SAM-dependent methyltransferase